MEFGLKSNIFQAPSNCHMIQPAWAATMVHGSVFELHPNG